MSMKSLRYNELLARVLSSIISLLTSHCFSHCSASSAPRQTMPLRTGTSIVSNLDRYLIAARRRMPVIHAHPQSCVRSALPLNRMLRRSVTWAMSTTSWQCFTEWTAFPKWSQQAVETMLWIVLRTTSFQYFSTFRTPRVLRMHQHVLPWVVFRPD